MDYYRIGQKIRKYRKLNGLSQENLAEMVNISVTHMSHIETGNTKLSLPVFVDIANALNVATDDLLNNEKIKRDVAVSEIAEILNNSSSEQIRIISDIIKATKLSLDRNNRH